MPQLDKQQGQEVRLAATASGWSRRMSSHAGHSHLMCCNVSGTPLAQCGHVAEVCVFGAERCHRSSVHTAPAKMLRITPATRKECAVWQPAEVAARSIPTSTPVMSLVRRSEAAPHWRRRSTCRTA